MRMGLVGSTATAGPNAKASASDGAATAVAGSLHVWPPSWDREIPGIRASHRWRSEQNIRIKDARAIASGRHGAKVAEGHAAVTGGCHSAEANACGPVGKRLQDAAGIIEGHHHVVSAAGNGAFTLRVADKIRKTEIPGGVVHPHQAVFVRSF